MKDKLIGLVVVGAGAGVGGIAINRAAPSSPASSTGTVETVLAGTEPFFGLLLFIFGTLFVVAMLAGVFQ